MNKELTKKQKEIILLLGSFRFINTNQFQKIFNHKDPHRIKVWLNDLINKGYIKTNYSRNTFQEGNHPAVYFLLTKSIKILKKEKESKSSNLEWIYKEGIRSERFINSSILITDIYLYFLSQIIKGTELNFFTKTNLKEFDYFPDVLPDAYISIKNKSKTQRYFLNYFDNLTPTFVLKNSIKEYIKYSQEFKWEENTGKLLPKIIFVCSNNNTLKKLESYTKQRFIKESENKLTLILLTVDDIKEDKSLGSCAKIKSPV